MLLTNPQFVIEKDQIFNRVKKIDKNNKNGSTFLKQK